MSKPTIWSTLSYGPSQRSSADLARILSYHSYLRSPQGRIIRWLDDLKAQHALTAVTGHPQMETWKDLTDSKNLLD